MTVSVERKPKGIAVLTVEIPVDEVKPFLARALRRLGSEMTIAGFRPGKAPEEVIRARVGEGKIWEEAAGEVIRSTFIQALEQEKIESVDQPDIEMLKLAPDNPISYRATVSLMPVIELGSWREVKVKKPVVTVTDQDVDKLIDELRELQVKEAAVARSAQKGDKVEINFELKRNGVVIEGGTGKKFPLVLGKGALIPGFEDHIVGLEPGGTKVFSVTFPRPYFNASLAGVEALVALELLTVLERTLPEKNDEWAQSAIGKPYVELVALLRENVTKEREDETVRKHESELVEKILQKVTFDDIPEVLVKREQDRMLHELKHDVTERGMQWNKYLESLKKSEESLISELVPHAEKRVKSALLMRALRSELKAEVTDTEVDEELEKQRIQYHDQADALKELDKPDYRAYVKSVLMNRKVMATLVAEQSL